MKKRSGKIMKLNNKQKRSVRRRIEIEERISVPRRIIFKSKKIYTRKNKHKIKKDE
jgi:hypothetical protein